MGPPFPLVNVKGGPEALEGLTIGGGHEGRWNNGSHIVKHNCENRRYEDEASLQQSLGNILGTFKDISIASERSCITQVPRLISSSP